MVEQTLDIVLAVHVAAGAVGLVVALPATLARKRRWGLHTWSGRGFAVLALVVAVTALLLVTDDVVELAGLGVLGILTGAWAGGGWWLARRRPRLPGGWLVWHLVCMGSAVIGFVTAFAVNVADGHPAAWAAPSVVGTVLISRAVQQRSTVIVARRTASRG